MAVAQAVAPRVEADNDDDFFDDGFPQPKEHGCTVVWVKVRVLSAIRVFYD